MYSRYSENKGADQLRGYREADLRLCFAYAKIRSSHGAAHMHHTYAYSYWTALCNGHQHHTCDYSYREAVCGGRVRIQLRSELYTFEDICAHKVPITLSQNYLTICSPYSSVVCNLQISCKDGKLGFVVLIGT